MSTSGPRRPPRGRRRPPGPGPGKRASAIAGHRTVRLITYWMVVGVGLLLLILWLVSGPLLGISGVTVAGYTGKQQVAVQQTADLVAGTGSMVRLPRGDMRAALTRFPGVLDATIERDWPRSITVEVEMGDPVAVLVLASGERYLLSPSGQVMGTAAGTAGLPVIRVASYPPGGVLSAPGQRAALTFIGWLPPEYAGRLRNVRGEGGRLFADLANGLELRIGTPTDLAEKAQALVAVLSQADPEALAAAAYLDLSNPRRPMLGSKVVPLPEGAGTSTTDGGTPTTDGGTGTTGSAAGGDEPLTDTTLQP